MFLTDYIGAYIYKDIVAQLGMNYDLVLVNDLSTLAKDDLLFVKSLSNNYRGLTADGRIHQVISLNEQVSDIPQPQQDFICTYIIDEQTLSYKNYKLFADNTPIFQQEVNTNLQIYLIHYRKS